MEFRVAFNTDNYEEVVAFYGTTLGFELTRSWDRDDSRGSLFKAGDGVVEVFAAARGGAPLGPPPRGSFSLMISVEDVEAVWERLGELDVETSGSPAVKPWGMKSFLVRDPHGTAVYFFEYV